MGPEGTERQGLARAQAADQGGEIVDAGQALPARDTVRGEAARPATHQPAIGAGRDALATRAVNRGEHGQLHAAAVAAVRVDTSVAARRVCAFARHRVQNRPQHLVDGCGLSVQQHQSPPSGGSVGPQLERCFLNENDGVSRHRGTGWPG